MANKKKNKKERSKKGFGIFLKILLAIFLLLLLLCFIKACRDCQDARNRVVTIVDQTGYLHDNERWENIPDVEPPYDEDDLDSLADKVSLEAFFPPIGDQNPYGTCVAWAAGYNLNTALNAIKNHWTTDQLADPVNQTSPKDLFNGIPSSDKGAGCEGTIFEPAFQVLKNSGVANMKTVPYKNLGSCNGRFVGDTTNRIASFNHVVSGGGIPSVGQIKAYLQDTIPLVIAAQLGDSFINWRGSDAIKNDTHYNPQMQHAFHAMALVGYDDSKHAFRLRNSWGTQWGDDGSIWVDYDYFMQDFCLEVFVASK